MYEISSDSEAYSTTTTNTTLILMDYKGNIHGPDDGSDNEACSILRTLDETDDIVVRIWTVELEMAELQEKILKRTLELDELQKKILKRKREHGYNESDDKRAIVNSDLHVTNA
jgi:hypothetical protein